MESLAQLERPDHDHLLTDECHQQSKYDEQKWSKIKLQLALKKFSLTKNKLFTC